MREVDEGFTAYRRWRGRESANPAAEFGECIMCADALSVGKGRFDVRWKEGVCLGIKAESGESLVGGGEGVIKAGDFRKKPEIGCRWKQEDFDKFRGVRGIRTQEPEEDSK